MATKTLYLIDTRVASGTINHFNVQEGGTAPTDAAFTAATGWEANSRAAGNSALLASNTEIPRNFVTAPDWTTTLQPAQAPNATRGDSWRAGPYTGTFAATAWALSVVVRSNSAAFQGRIRFRWRVWKSGNADGSGATQLTAAQIVSAATSTIMSLAANNAPLSASWSPGAISLNNEYLFFQLGIEITQAGTANTQDVHLRKHLSMAITTPDFTAVNAPVTLAGVASDESVGTLATSPGVAAATLAGVASDEQTGSLTAIPLNDPIPLSGVASDEQVGTLTATPGAATGSLTGADTDELAGSVTGVPGAVGAVLTGVNSDESTGTLIAAPGGVTAALTGLSSDETIGSVVGQPGTVTVTLAGVDTDEIVGGFVMGEGGTETLVGVSTDEQIGSLDASPGAVLLSLSALSTDELTGELVAVAGTVTISLAGIDTDELVGTLAGEVGAVVVIPGETLPRNMIRVSGRDNTIKATKEGNIIRAFFFDEIIRVERDTDVIRATRGVT